MNYKLMIWCLFFHITSSGIVSAQQIDGYDFKNGDLLFQNLDCGPLCDAIETVTRGIDGSKFSHIGMVYRRNDSVYVLEAIGSDVHLTPLHSFLKRSSHKVYIGRVKKRYAKIADRAVVNAISKIGVAYDDVFIYNNGKYYCSELIYDAFKAANDDKPFFRLQPMTFKEPETNAFFNVWVDYYKELNMPIPEGKPGINPGGISRSRNIRILNK